MGGRGALEGVIPFIILFALLFFVHSKLYDFGSYLFEKIKEKYLKYFPSKSREKA
ncbi:hypothetical protein [Desulfonema magnum]|uniref:Uncharacterized protein n=1 Tax=Desulfonema magnum TaxID=45655 RepID=A0A975BTW9_9BACT|nr:hypothetical protein [Desulfonema magnum]QTA91656.1 Uncharacterized protein dnm_077290 [Desulfonema magnum]